jgi:hypothetical protein
MIAPKHCNHTRSLPCIPSAAGVGWSISLPPLITTPLPFLCHSTTLLQVLAGPSEFFPPLAFVGVFPGLATFPHSCCPNATVTPAPAAVCVAGDGINHKAATAATRTLRVQISAIEKKAESDNATGAGGGADAADSADDVSGSCVWMLTTIARLDLSEDLDERATAFTGRALQCVGTITNTNPNSDGCSCNRCTELVFAPCILSSTASNINHQCRFYCVKGSCNGARLLKERKKEVHEVCIVLRTHFGLNSTIRRIQ